MIICSLWMNQENSKIERRKLEIEYEVFLGHYIFQREGSITCTVKVCIAYKTPLRLNLTDWLCYRTSSVATLCFNFLTLGCIHNVYYRESREYFLKGQNFLIYPYIIQNFLTTPPLGQKIPPFRWKYPPPSPRPPPLVYIMNAALVHSWLVESCAFKRS